MRPIRRAPWFAVPILVLALAGWTGFHEAILANTTVAGASGPSGPKAVAPGGTNDPVDRYAWDEFASLVHPASKGAKPGWVHWSTKCEAGLISACDGTPPTSSSGRPGDQAAAELPRQILAEYRDASTQRNNDQAMIMARYARAPELASVLFNPVAAESIRRANLGRKSTLDMAIEQLDDQQATGALRRLPTGTFEEGSEIVKLMWEVVPAVPDRSIPLFDPNQPPLEPGQLQYFGTGSWDAEYSLDPKAKCDSPLPPYGGHHNRVVVPLNCFYHFTFGGGETCEGLSVEVKPVYCLDAFKGQSFYAILVGFHVMKLIPTNPNWVWMTFYWTRFPNDSEAKHPSSWANPWNHFHEATTTAIRELAPPGHQLCFSPYLEAPSHKNGVVSNCLSCHSFSAYAPGESRFQEGSNLGLTYPYSASQRQQDESEYFRGAVQTSFVWSVSTSQDPSVQKTVQSFNQAFEAELHRMLGLK